MLPYAAPPCPSPNRGHRRVIPGTLALDPREPVLVVHCTVESTVTDNDGRMRTETTAQQRSVRVPRVPEDYDDCVAMAEELVGTCKYLAGSQQSEVEQLLHQLHQRAVLERERLAALQASNRKVEVSMEQLEAYLEPLYDHETGPAADAAKVEGTAMILELARDVGNLEALAQDPALLGALSRVLADEALGPQVRGWRGCSQALLYNVLRLFLVFSNFYEASDPKTKTKCRLSSISMLHEALAAHRIGSLTMRVLEAEIKKTQEQQQQHDEPSRHASRQGAPPEERRRALKLLFAGTHVLFNLASNLAVEEKMTRRGLVALLLPLLDTTSSSSTPPHAWLDLVLLALRFLGKLSLYEENVAQMRTGGHAAALLVPWLPCPSHDAVTAAAFALAHNLAFDPVIRAQLRHPAVLPKLVAMLGRPGDGAKAATGPSYSCAFRGQALRLLYQLSTDAEGVAALAAPELGLVPVVRELVLGWPRGALDETLGALAVNVGWDARAAGALTHKAGLRRLVDRLLRHRDPLVAKLVRGVSRWSLERQAALADPEAEYELRSLWPSHVQPLAALALELSLEKKTTNGTTHGAARLLVEVLGTLGNLTPPDLPIGSSWREVLAAYPLARLCVDLLLATGGGGGNEGGTEPDVALEAVGVLQALALDSSVAADLVQAGAVGGLHAVWRRLGPDDEPEVALQVLVALERLLHHPETRAALLAASGAGGLLEDVAAAVGHGNSAVRKAARACVALLVEIDRQAADGTLEELGEDLCRRRFEAHNRAWLEAVAWKSGMKR